MTTTSVEDMALEERKFLHDIANHLVVAHGMSNFVYRSIKTNTNVEAKDIDRLERTIEAINKMTALLKERRAHLHSLSE